MSERGERAREAKGWFLTYPKSGEVTPEALLEALSLKETIVEYVIAQEEHQDGSHHLHAFLKLEKKRQFKKDRFDVDLGGKLLHGNYQIAKSWRAVQEYCQKGGKFISNIDIDAAKNGHAKGILKEHFDMDALDLLDQGILKPMQLNNFLKNQSTYRQLTAQKTRTQFLTTLPKKRHYWLYGETDSGKTVKLRSLLNEFGPANTFQIPPNDDWVGYTGQRLLYFDEYVGQLTIQSLNRLCDGDAKVNTKGGSTQICSDPIVIICSNKTIEGAYNKAEFTIVRTLHSRFNFIDYHYNNEPYTNISLK